ncbi:MAG: GGDEF domain-containing protein [Nanoarchaeota archaeon]
MEKEGYLEELVEDEVPIASRMQDFRGLEEEVAFLRRHGQTLAEDEYQSRMQNILDYSMNLLKHSVRNQTTGEYGRPAKEIFLENLDGQVPENMGIYVASVDIDKFKTFNDNYGHKNGDVVLSKVARIARESLRRGEGSAFHVSGEEIEVIYFAEDDSIAKKIAQRIRSNVESEGVFRFRRDYEAEQEEIPVTVSMGITRYVQEKETIEDAIHRADTYGLQYAKNHGRNQVEFVDVTMDSGKYTVLLRDPARYEYEHEENTR